MICLLHNYCTTFFCTCCALLCLLAIPKCFTRYLYFYQMYQGNHALSCNEIRNATCWNPDVLLNANFWLLRNQEWHRHTRDVTAVVRNKHTDQRTATSADADSAGRGGGGRRSVRLQAEPRHQWRTSAGDNCSVCTRDSIGFLNVLWFLYNTCLLLCIIW